MFKMPQLDFPGEFQFESFNKLPIETKYIATRKHMAVRMRLAFMACNVSCVVVKPTARKLGKTEVLPILLAA